jgi:hypothetical protein
MPHLVLVGSVPATEILTQLQPTVRRWGRAVIKTERCWLRQDGRAVLVEGVVVELSRPLHPVALVEGRGDRTVVRLWPLAPVERTRAVQRWLALLAADLCGWGAGPLVATNLSAELVSDLALGWPSPPPEIAPPLPGLG